MTRGTTNGNVRGSAQDRARRRAWLVDTYRADVDVQMISGYPFSVRLGNGEPACRCYRCGELLTITTVTETGGALARRSV